MYMLFLRFGSTSTIYPYLRRIRQHLACLFPKVHGECVNAI
jgi:hypothetical protein